MQTCAGTPHDSLGSLPFTIPSSRPRMRTADESAEDGVKCGNAQQGITTYPSQETILGKPNARQRLEALSGFRMDSDEIEFSPSDLNRSGGKADVAKATIRLDGGTEEELVAVKKHRYFQRIDKKKFANEFTHEVEMMAGLSHPNIIRLIGFIEDLENGIAWIVLSWLPNGNLREFLATEEWEIPERISLIKDIFIGIGYLHSQSPPICHGDLKSFNILISSSNEAVITDFGSARAIDVPEDEAASDEDGQQVEGNSTTKQDRPQIHVTATDNQLTLTAPRWTLRWAAPELFSGRCPALSSDIWAAGWVCWEVMTNKVPFPELNSEGLITLTVVRGEVPSLREDAHLAQIVALCSLMTDCWKVDPKARPTIERCWDELKWMPSTLPVCREHPGSRVPSAALLIELADTNLQQGNHEKAISLFQQALGVARAKDDRTGAAMASQGIASSYLSQYKFNNAEEWLFKAYKAYTDIGHDRGRAATLGLLGAIYRSQSKYILAEEFLTRAGRIFTHIGADVGRAQVLDGLGYLYISQLKYVQAEEAFTQALEIHTHIGSDRGQALALFGLGYVYRYQSKYTQAQESYTRSLEIYARLGPDQNQANTLTGLGDVYRLQSRYIQAEELYNQAQEICTRLGNEHGRANTLVGLGHLYFVQSKYTQAEESYTQAQETFTRLGNHSGLGAMLNYLGRIYCCQSKYAQAEESFIGAQEIFARCGDEPGQAMTLEALGDVYRLQSKYILAEESYSLAHEIFDRLGYDIGRADTLTKIADTYGHSSKYTHAEECFTRAHEIYTGLGDHPGQATTLNDLGHIYRCQSKYAQAEESFIGAQEIYARLGDDHSRADTLVELGRVYRLQLKYSQAEESYTRARDIFARLGDLSGQANTLRLMGFLHRNRGQNVEAAVDFAEARNLFDRLGLTKDAEEVLYQLALVIPLPEETSCRTTPDTSIPTIPSL